MKEKGVFISDFDGTITAKDFYWILLDDYIGQKGIDYYHEWKKSRKIDTEFLNTVFAWKEFTEFEKNEAISKVSIDPLLEEVITFTQNQGFAFWILSAGFDYYIKKALAMRGLEKTVLYTNPGDFIDHTFKMSPNINAPFYSPIYGIDKEKVALEAKKQFERIIFAGDSEPDLKAALQADVIFAKHELARLLDERHVDYYVYNDFSDILVQLKKINL